MGSYEPQSQQQVALVPSSVANADSKEVVAACVFKAPTATIVRRVCDRKTAKVLFLEVQKVIGLALENIRSLIAEARRRSSRPHPAAIRRIYAMTPELLNRSNSTLRSYVSETGVYKGVLFERAKDVYANLNPSAQSEDFHHAIEQTVTASLQYQLSVKLLLQIDDALRKHYEAFAKTFARYDVFLAMCENRPNQLPADFDEQVASIQQELDVHKKEIQQLINQIPNGSCGIRSDLDFMQYYGREDDSLVVHAFLTSNAVFNYIKRQAPGNLRQAYKTVAHDWSALAV